MTDSKALVDKLWNYCNVLRDELVFRGGTCLHKLYLPEAQRYSDRPDSVMRHLSSIPRSKGSGGLAAYGRVAPRECSHVR